MKHSTLSLHPQFQIDQVDPRVFGGFLEHLGRAVYEGIYDPNSIHADASGCRTDVLEALRHLRFTAMRYPGGNFVSGYDWTDGVGPVGDRPSKRDLAWQSLEPNRFGTNEFIDLSRKMGWTPMLAVNLGTGTPSEARNWLEYCNGTRGTYWADKRIEHGYEQPHDVKLWCLGNEMDGPWQIGHVPAENYAITAQQTARLMKMFDPTVELVVCGSCAPELPTYLEWDRKVLEYLHNDVDYISLHRYVGNPEGDTEDYLAVGASIEKQINEQDAVCKYVAAVKRSKRRVMLSFDEWNVWYRARHGEHVDGAGKFAPPLLEEVYNLEDALVVAQFLNSFIRHADSIKIANLAQIVNVIAPILTKADKMLIQSIFYPIEMMAKRRDGIALQVEVNGAEMTSKSYGTVQTLDASAILNGNRVAVFCVNRSPSRELEITVDLATADFVQYQNGELVTGRSADAANTYADPCQVTSECFDGVRIEHGKAILVLPPLSFFAGTLLADL